MPNNAAHNVTGTLNLAPVSLGMVRKQQVGPSLLWSQDFSTNATGIDNVAGLQYVRTTSNPPPGKTHSIRFNAKSIVDPITGITGSNVNTGTANPGINPTLHNQMTWVLKFRFDDFLCGGFTGAQTDINGKLVYMSGYGAGDSQNGFYLSGAMGGASGNLNCGDNGGGPWVGWQNETYGWNLGNGNPTTVAYGSTGQPWGTDGQWHELRVKFDYHNGGAGYGKCRVEIDGNPVNFTNGNSTDGWFNIPPAFRCDRMRLFYGDATAMANSTDRTGVAAGIQWGGLEVYSGIVAGNTVSFTGTGFGTGPTIEIFDRVDRGADGQVLSLTDGVDIGAWSGYSNTVSGNQNTAFCKSANGRNWMANRHLSFLADTASRACGFEKALSAKSKDLYFSYRWLVPSGFKFPGSNNLNEISNVSSNFKVTWWWDADDGDLAGDVCIPTFPSSTGCTVAGNAFRPESAVGGSFGFNRAKLSGTGANHVSFYQIAGTDGAYNGKAGIRSVSPAGFYNEEYSDVEVFNKPNANAFGLDGYSRFLVGGWMGNTNFDNALCLFADMYVAIGQNCRARIVTHNAPDLASSTEVYDLPPSSWTSTSVISVEAKPWEQLAYASLILGDGTVAQTKATGW